MHRRMAPRCCSIPVAATSSAHCCSLRCSTIYRASPCSRWPLFVGLVAVQRKSSASLRRSCTDLENKVRDLERLNAALQIENTERQRAEQKSREIERELQLTIDMIPVKITVYRADGAPG